MPSISKNFEINKISDANALYIVYCRDREAIDERWVVSSLSEEEARKLYIYLGEYFQ